MLIKISNPNLYVKHEKCMTKFKEEVEKLHGILEVDVVGFLKILLYQFRN